MAAVTICSDFGAPPQIKSLVSVSTVSPSICHEVMGPDAIILVFWMLSFKPTYSLFFFTFIKKLFSSSLSAISVVLRAYLRLLVFLPEILIPACASSSPAFLMMYSAYKLNNQGDNIQPMALPQEMYGSALPSGGCRKNCSQMSRSENKGHTSYSPYSVIPPSRKWKWSRSVSDSLRPRGL